jgi:hypothetical protein
MAKMSRQGRAQLIVDILDNTDGGLTELDLARMQGLKKSPYFRSILDDLLATESITVFWAHGWNNRPTCYYIAPGRMNRMEGF